jgi:hypothetical protein
LKRFKAEESELLGFIVYRPWENMPIRWAHNMSGQYNGIGLKGNRLWLTSG